MHDDERPCARDYFLRALEVDPHYTAAQEALRLLHGKMRYLAEVIRRHPALHYSGREEVVHWVVSVEQVPSDGARNLIGYTILPAARCRRQAPGSRRFLGTSSCTHSGKWSDNCIVRQCWNRTWRAVLSDGRLPRFARRAIILR